MGGEPPKKEDKILAPEQKASKISWLARGNQKSEIDKRFGYAKANKKAKYEESINYRAYPKKFYSPPKIVFSHPKFPTKIRAVINIVTVGGAIGGWWVGLSCGGDER